MNVILALFLCGVVYATALPTCSEKELDQCQISPDAGDDLESEVFLKEACRTVECVTNYVRRCGTEGLHPETQAKLKQGERIYNTMCGKDKSMRQKYFDNIRCITTVSKDFSTSCPTVTEFSVHDPNYCPKVEKFISCTKKLLRRECGSDASEVYEPFAPDLKFYGC